MSMDFIGLSVGMGYTDETVIGGGAIKGKNCVISNIEEVADGVNVTFQSILDDGTVKTDTVFIPKGTQGEAGVAGKSAYEIWLEAGNTGTEEDFLISLVGEKGADGTMTFEDLTEEQKESLKGEIGEMTEEIRKGLEDIENDIEQLKVYVTPEMFGAVGDGVTDDSVAIKSTIENGGRIIFDNKKTYLIGSELNISVPKYVDIDFNDCALDINAPITFNNEEVVNLGSVSYTAGSRSVSFNTDLDNGILLYVVPSTDETNWNNENMYSGARNQYVLGFSSRVVKNLLQTTFNHNVSNAVASYFPQKIVNISNISDIKTSNNFSGNAFSFNGVEVKISNVNSNDYTQMNLLTFNYSMVSIEHCKLISKYNGSDIYGICICCCSNWKVSNIVGQNSWHTITTGGSFGVSLYGVIDSCELITNNDGTKFAYSEHENTFGTKIVNSTIYGIRVEQGCLVENSNIYECLSIPNAFYSEYADNITYKGCMFNLTKSANLVYAEYDSTKLYEGGTNTNFIDCKFDCSTSYGCLYGSMRATTNYKHLFGTLTFKNCEMLRNEYGAFINLGTYGDDYEYNQYQKIVFDGCLLDEWLTYGGATDNANIEVTLKNCNYTNSRINLKYGKLIINVCNINDGVTIGDYETSDIIIINCITPEISSSNVKYVNCVNKSYIPIVNTV